jgi:hypothetical protein
MFERRKQQYQNMTWNIITGILSIIVLIGAVQRIYKNLQTKKVKPDNISEKKNI